MTINRTVFGSFRFWIVLAYGCLFLAFLPHSLQRQETLGIDFPIFYSAAQNHGVTNGYIYPPLFSFLLYPLSLLPLSVAIVGWYLIQAVALLIVLWYTTPLTLRGTQFIVALLFQLAVVWTTILNAELGQVNTVILLLLLLTIRYEHKKRGALSLGIASAIKLSPSIFLPFLLFRTTSRRWLTALVWIATIALSIFVPMMAGYSVSGLTQLVEVSQTPGQNIGIPSILPEIWKYLVIALCLASIYIGYRSPHRNELWYVPVLLMIICPPFLRKAHLITGVLLGSAVGSSRRLVSYVPVLWAIGSLGTMLWSSSAIVGTTAALLVLLVELMRTDSSQVRNVLQ